MNNSIKIKKLGKTVYKFSAYEYSFITNNLMDRVVRISKDDLILVIKKDRKLWSKDYIVYHFNSKKFVAIFYRDFRMLG